MSKGKFRTRSCTIRETQVAANLPPVIGGRGAGSGAGGRDPRRDYMEAGARAVASSGEQAAGSE